jgi:hypothetical protein
VLIDGNDRAEGIGAVALSIFALRRLVDHLDQAKGMAASRRMPPSRLSLFKAVAVVICWLVDRQCRDYHLLPTVKGKGKIRLLVAESGKVAVFKPTLFLHADWFLLTLDPSDLKASTGPSFSPLGFPSCCLMYCLSKSLYSVSGRLALATGVATSAS